MLTLQLENKKTYRKVEFSRNLVRIRSNWRTILTSKVQK